ncbi:MAG: hypothetical protein U0903_01400 [Planctomycetales bacterium]
MGEARPNKETLWTILNPSEIIATSHGKLKKEEDQSIIALGEMGREPTRSSPSRRSRASRRCGWKCSPDPRLPNKGPGRAADGNFVLSEFEVDVAPADMLEKVTQLKFDNAKADYSQGGYNVLSAINGTRNPTDDGWAVAGEFGKNHTAVFELPAPVAAAPTQLTIELHHQFADPNFTVGRFRLSVTNSVDPIFIGPQPQPVAAALAKPAKTGTKRNGMRSSNTTGRRRSTLRTCCGGSPPRSDRVPSIPSCRNCVAIWPVPNSRSRSTSSSCSFGMMSRPARSNWPIRPVDRRPGHRLGVDQQPGIPVQPLMLAI